MVIADWMVSCLESHHLLDWYSVGRERGFLDSDEYTKSIIPIKQGKEEERKGKQTEDPVGTEKALYHSS